MEGETGLILLFVVATAVALAARRVGIPYTVALVLAGLALGGLSLFPAPALTKTLVFAVLLPGLVFEAAFHIDSREFRANLLTILLLAIPGVIVSTALVTLALTPIIGALHLSPVFDWKIALVFGALISATDPVAVVALFRNLGAPGRLTLLLDAESLLNDGTAIVFFTLALSLATGSATTVGALSWQFLTMVVGGGLIGILIGGLAATLTRRIDDPMIEITLTVIAAYGSFVTAETLSYSGVIATVAAGMLCGNYGSRGGGMSASTRVAAESFWEYAAFSLNSIVFLLIGLEIHPIALRNDWFAIVVAYLVVTTGRGLMIVIGRAALGLTRERFPWSWCILLTWGGLRGALPMVLVLSLPKNFPNRDLLISMTYGVAVLSILGHGLTMSGLLHWLGLAEGSAGDAEYEFRTGRLQAATAALQELDRLERARTTTHSVLDRLRAEYSQRLETAELELRKLTVSSHELQQHDLRRLHRHLLDVERGQVLQAFEQGALGRASYQRLMADIDARAIEPGQPAYSVVGEHTAREGQSLGPQKAD
jgi:CPA1 family monovalent cation:H+ antiporter